MNASDRRSAAGALAVVAAVALASCSPSSQRPLGASHQPAPSPSYSSAESFRWLQVDGQRRLYLLSPARNLRPGQRAALVLVLHNLYGTVRGARATLGLDGLRDRGITLAYLAGTDGSWNAGRCCLRPVERRVDDLGFLAAVFADAPRHTPVDPARRGLVGNSVGGMLIYRYLCEGGPPVAAVVEVAGTDEYPCTRPLRLPQVLSLHGTGDRTIPLRPPTSYSELIGTTPRPAIASIRRLAVLGGCLTPTVESDAATIRTEWVECRTGGVQMVEVRHGDHTWGSVAGGPRVSAFLWAALGR